MAKFPLHLPDERGFYTLSLPKPGFADMLYRFAVYRKLSHYILYLRLRHAWIKKHIWLVAALPACLLVVFIGISFFLPRTVTLRFSGENCLFAPQLLPRLTKQHVGARFQTSSKPLASINGYPLISHETCIHAVAAPEAETTERLSLAPFGNPLLKKHISIKTAALPKAVPQFDPTQAIGTGSSFAFALDQEDQLFTYTLRSGEETAACTQRGFVVTCALESLRLKPGSQYMISLLQSFQAEQHELLTTSITTLDPVVISSASIAAGSTVFDKPHTLTLTLNKAVQNTGVVTLVETANKTTIPDVASDLKDKEIQISFGELARQKTYRLDVSNLTGLDGSQLEAPYVLEFTTSGGPKVVSAFISTYKVPLNKDVVLAFDVGLESKQEFSKFIKLESAAGAIPATISVNDNKLTINPVSDLPRCTNFTLKVAAGLVSSFGVGNGEAWQLSSRTICQIASSIGTSVKGRAITAYRFGSGASKILFVGGTHGNEKSSVATLNALVDYLEQHAHEIPAHRSVIIIPNLNPDGYASSSRTNANTVDLNRNFPSNDWQTAIQMPGGQNLPNGGGMSPLDQPEASALASYVQSQNPRVVLTYHAVARIVISNDVGDSITLSQQYASESGYKFSSNADSHGTFEYATTGEFEDWLADKESIPGILVELGTMGSNEFNTHRKAMWAMIQLP